MTNVLMIGSSVHYFELTGGPNGNRTLHAATVVGVVDDHGVVDLQVHRFNGDGSYLVREAPHADRAKCGHWIWPEHTFTLKPETVIERDTRLNISSEEIKNEIIVEVGMMADARTPEMTARYEAALARERIKNVYFTPDVLPDQSVDIEGLQYDLEEIRRRLGMAITRLRAASVTPMLLGELEAADKHLVTAGKEAAQLYDW